MYLIRLGQAVCWSVSRVVWGSHVKNYSIVRIGNDYVVQADDQSVLKIASRRRAAKLVTDAAKVP